MRKYNQFALLAASILLFSGCSTDGGVNPMIDQNTDSSAALPAISGAKGSKPTISAPVGSPPSTLQKSDIYVGDGKEANDSSILEVHYTLMAWSSGTLVESSWDSGQTATFPLRSNSSSGVRASNVAPLAQWMG